MIIELEERLRVQREAELQPDAFFTAWRLMHLGVRAFLINKLCDGSAINRVIASLSDNNKPSDAELSRVISSSVRIVQPLEDWAFRRFANRINQAPERELLGKYMKLVTNFDFAEHLSQQHNNLWNSYRVAATQARHFLAHGKVFGTRQSTRLSYDELTECLVGIWHSVQAHFWDDGYMNHVLMGGPLPPMANFHYNSTTKSAIISEDPTMVRPTYGEPGERDL